MSVFIVTPCFNGISTTAFDQSCINLRKELTANNFPFEFFRVTNDSLITRARNVCASTFLYDTDFDMLCSIDSDIEFSPADFARLWNLCKSGADVAAGAYRHKNPKSKLQAWVKGKLHDLSVLGQEPFEVDFAGTGFMMVRRQTFEKLQKSHPDWEYEEGDPPQQTWAFYQDPIIDYGNSRVHLSEDYFFCAAVKEAGMKVMMDPLIELKHWGMYPY